MNTYALNTGPGLVSSRFAKPPDLLMKERLKNGINDKNGRLLNDQFIETNK